MAQLAALPLPAWFPFWEQALFPASINGSFRRLSAISFVLGAIGFTGLTVGCSLLVTETRLAIRSMNEEAQMAKNWAK